MDSHKPWESKRNRWSFIFILSSITATQVLFLLLLLVFASPILFPGPLKYSQDIYYPTDPVLCPGDILSVNLVFDITEGPVAVGEIISWWDIETNQNLITDSDVDYGWYFDPGTYERINEIVVPVLPAGHDYEMRGGRYELQRKIDTYKVPFSIPDGCKTL